MGGRLEGSSGEWSEREALLNDQVRSQQAQPRELGRLHDESQAKIRDLEEGKARLEEQLKRCMDTAKELSERVEILERRETEAAVERREEFRARVAELLAGLQTDDADYGWSGAWLEQKVRSQDAELRKLRQLYDESQAWIREVEKGKAWLEEQWKAWMAAAEHLEARVKGFESRESAVTAVTERLRKRMGQLRIHLETVGGLTGEDERLRTELAEMEAELDGMGRESGERPAGDNP